MTIRLETDGTNGTLVYAVSFLLVC